jgi:predicted chitinase
MKSTLFVVCLALALACSNAIGSMGGGGGFRGGSSSMGSRGGSSYSAPRMSAPSIRPSTPSIRPSTPSIRPSMPSIRPSVPSIRPAVRPSAPAVRPSAPAVRPSAPAVRPSMPKVTPRPTPTIPKVNAPPRVTPTIPKPVPRPTPVQPKPTPVKPAPIQTPRPVQPTPKPTPIQTPKPVQPTPKPAPIQTPKPVTPISTPKPNTPAPAGGLSVQQLQKMMPQANSKVLNQYAPYLNKAMQDAGINTPARQNAFLAQLGHESGQFRYMQELASGKAYEGRKDLGNTSPGDGVKYKGRGPIQITGKANYAAAGKALGIDLVNHPELAATPEVGFKTAAWFWNQKGLNAKADKGTADSFSQITKAINGCANCKQTHAAERNNLWANNNKINQ